MSRYRTPVIFLSHGGGPCFFMEGKHSPLFAEIDKHSNTASFLKSILTDKYVSVKPKAILVISAHWEETIPTVGYRDSESKLYYDYYGFPKETYDPYLTYQAPSDLALASRVHELLSNAGIPSAKENRGFDHGVFIPMKLAVPDESIPIVQLSLLSNQSPEQHIKLGAALSPLRDENVLIITSGSLTHNLRELRQSSPNSAPVPWATAFVNWVKATVEVPANDLEAIKASINKLARIENVAPELRQNHPTLEHLLPLHVAAGASYGSLASAGNPAEEATIALDGSTSGQLFGERIHDKLVAGSMSLDSYIFR